MHPGHMTRAAALLRPEVLSFLAVGAAGYVVDVVAFNWFRSSVDPTLAKVLAVAAAMVVTYLGNRLITWRDRTSTGRHEIALFVLFNIIGLGISVGMLLLTHNLLGMTSRLADNISANVIGLGLGTAFRYWSYRRFVFARRRRRRHRRAGDEPGPGRPASRAAGRAQPARPLSPPVRCVAGGPADARIMLAPGGRFLPALTRVPQTVYLAAAAAGVLWLPTFMKPLSSDEGGFLLVASQWSPGTSLYGDYWVDRPPLLIGLFQVADLGGGSVALRIIGLLAVVGSVLLAGAIGHTAAPENRAAPVFASLTAMVFMTTQLFGAAEVDGELLAVPWVLLGMLAVLRALRRTPHRVTWWVVAGAASMAAPLVKQSMVDGFVLAAVVIAWLLRRHRAREAASGLALFALGGAAVLVTTLAWAMAHGTSPSGLWDAVVVFRGQAAAVISSKANSATPQRAVEITEAFLASGALIVLVAAFLPGRHRERPASDAQLPDLRLLAGAVLAWESVAVVSGGSYWLHYLIGSVAGLVLAAVAVAIHRPRRTRVLAMALAYGAVVGVAATVAVTIHESGTSSDVAVERYLSEHRQVGDTATVAFGDPAILQAAHLSSPYPQLWSLPVRVRDSQLAAFTQTLLSPDRPTWIVVSGTSLATWGVDTSQAQPVLDREYRVVHTVDDLNIYRVRAATPVAAAPSGR